MISSTKIFDSETFSDWIVYNDETHREYLVTVDHEDDICYCTCPDFQYRKQTEKLEVQNWMTIHIIASILGR